MTGEDEQSSPAEDLPPITSAKQATAGGEKKLILTKEALDKFYALLDPDKEKAASRELKLREMLHRLFSIHKSVHSLADVESLTDSTIDRLISKVDKGEEINNVEAYSLGIAHNVFLEYTRRQEVRNTGSIGDLPDGDVGEKGLSQLDKLLLEEESGIRNECLRRCFQKLKPRQQERIIEYYDYDNTKPGEGARARDRMADKVGISQKSLTKRVHRVRAKLEECVKKCVAKNALKSV